MDLNTSIRELPRIGEAQQRKLQRLGIKTIEDLLWHFPSRYEDFSNLCPINKVKVNQKCCVAGKILDIKTQRTWKKRMFITEALIEDKTGAIKAVWFNQPYLTKTLKPGESVCLAGKVVFNKNGLSLSSPAYEKIYSEKELTHMGRIIPIYPETAGLSSRFLRWIIKPLLQEFKNEIPEILPSFILKKQKLLPVQQALEQIHFPRSLKEAELAKNRFAFEELFLIELSVLQERLHICQQKAPAIPFNVELIKDLVGSLPFQLTDAQRKCAYQILKDMEKPIPMSRLLEGDVGSGKTVVAVIAALSAVRAGWQVAFMAPTEILAKQHFGEVSKLLQPFRVRIALLTGKEDKIISQKLGHQTKSGWRPEVLEISRSKILEKAKKGEIDILIGTHTLIQDKVKFNKLALAIIDEQHRFGVEQRANLCRNSHEVKLLPHLLSMTATPIPRTLALTVYGDLDLSIIDEMPKGRKKVITKVVPPKDRKNTYGFIKKEVKEGKRVFVICPRIEPGKTETAEEPALTKDPFSWTEAKAVKEEYEKLSQKVFPELKVEMLHGKMKTKEKEKIMQNFKSGKTDILVSTSVVEVGVDIPKATVMMIEGAERFGLAQLHQFRGRVGRSDLQAYCFLFTESPAKKTRQRLRAIMEAENGFELAQKDLDIRGPGSLFGAKQWGLPDLAMENLRNLPLVETTRELAKEILQGSPNLAQYPLLKKHLKTFEKRLHLE